MIKEAVMKNGNLPYRAARLAGALALMVLTAWRPALSDMKKAGTGEESMEKECRQHCEKAMKSMEQSMKTMREAEKSGDAAKRRAALDQGEKAMASMKDHMGMCQNMMGMHGGGQDHMKGMDMGGGSTDEKGMDMQ
jgi:hypothetical protein